MSAGDQRAATRRTATAYDIVASSYAAALPNTSYEDDADLALVRRFVDLLPQPVPSVLDAGCGTGRMLALLRSLQPAVDVTGVDVSPGMLEIARATYPHARFQLGDIAAIPAGDASFDGVLGWYSIIHTAPDALPGVLDEFRRVLRPHGALLLGFQSGDGDRHIDRAYGHDVDLPAFLHRPAAVADAATHAGFRSVDVVERRARPSERHAQGFVIATL